MAKSKKSKPEIRIPKLPDNEQVKAFSELVSIAIDISLCEPTDTEELSKLIPRLRKVIKKIRMMGR